MLAQLKAYGTVIKWALVAGAVIALAFVSYDYGKTSAENAAAADKAAAYEREQALLDKVEQKQDEAFRLSVELASQQPIIEKEIQTIEKKVIKYVQANNDKRCIVDDSERLQLRADAYGTYNRAIDILESTGSLTNSTNAP